MANIILKRLAAFALFLLATSSGVSISAPVVIDRPDFKLMVMRSLDQWTPNKSGLEKSLEAFKEKEYRFQIIGANGKGEDMFSNVFSSSNLEGKSQPMMNAYTLASGMGWKPAYKTRLYFILDAPTSTDGITANKAIKAQSEAFKALVLKMGNPEDLQEAFFAKEVLGSLLAVGITAASLDKFGGTFTANAIVGSNIAGDLSSLPNSLSRSLPFAFPVQGVDLASYKQVDFRTVRGPSSAFGQVIIAYKDAKSPEVEIAALSKALESLIGLDTDVPNIEAARAEDFERRKTIWKACMTDTTCKAQATKD